MAGVYGKHMHRITGMVGIDKGQPEQLAGNNTLEKKLEFDPKMRQFMQLQNVGPCHLPLLPQYKVTYNLCLPNVPRRCQRLCKI